jgi:7-cyano-7-deazaguanine synthase
VVILSGGPDSAVVLYLARREGYRVNALTFDYGQLAGGEIRLRRGACAARRGGVARFDLSGMKGLYRGATALTDEAMGMTGEFTSRLVVPFRNGIMIAIAVAYADSIGASTVLYGAQQSDAEHYPDCREEFVRGI